MRRPISIAMFLSTVIHVALFAVAGWLLSNVAVPSVTSTTLLVSIEPLQTAGAIADNDHLVPAADSEAANFSKNRQASRSSANPPEITQVAQTVVAAEITPRDLKSTSEVTSFANQVAVDREDAIVEDKVASLVDSTEVTGTEVVTTISPGEAVVVVGAMEASQPVPAQASLSPKQEKMLRREIREWTEDLHRMPDVASGLTWMYQGQEYVARFTQFPAADDMDIQRAIIEISTEEDGKRLSSEVHMKRLAFSSYAQLVNRWDPRVQIHNDELDGRFHSNSEISLTYDREARPLFNGMVTTTSRRVNFASSSGLRNRDQIFAGGLRTGASLIRLPKHVLPFPSEAGIVDDQIHHFGEDTRITFYADGSYAWQAIESKAPQQLADISGDTKYLIADENVVMYVKGTVNGKVLVYSPERIVIEDDLIYEQNPEEVPDADDYLGLVSDKYVDIAPPDITGPGDLWINAAIYAKRRFAVRGYRFRQSALLYLYGSLSVGSLSATEPRYNTRIRFDQRLEEIRPPGFPMTDLYEVESWDATWNVEPIE